MNAWVTWGEWFTSPGFGGLAAVIAASIAYIGVARTLKVQREAQRRQQEAARKQQWWERARWALDLTLSDDTTTRAIGLEVLDALGTSEYADEHEFDVVDAAVAPTLQNYAAQEGHVYGDDGPNTSGEAHLEQEDPRGDG